MNTVDLAKDYLSHNAAESGADELIRTLIAVVEQQQTALKYGRDCVMESFEHVKNTDDQVMADARLQAIDAALGHQQ